MALRSFLLAGLRRANFRVPCLQPRTAALPTLCAIRHYSNSDQSLSERHLSSLQNIAANVIESEALKAADKNKPVEIITVAQAHNELSDWLCDCVRTEHTPTEKWRRLIFSRGTAEEKASVAWHCFQLVQQHNRVLSTEQFNIMLDVLGRAPMADLRQLWSVVQHMELQGQSPDQYTYTAMIKACVNADKLERGMQVLREMMDKGLNQSVVPFATLLDAYSKDMDEPAVRQVLGMIKEANVEMDAGLYNIVLRMLLKKKKVDEANEVLQRMYTTGVAFTSHTLSLLLMYCVDDPQYRPKDWFNLVESFEEEGISLNMAGCDIMMLGCAKRRDLGSACTVLQMAQSRKLSFDVSFLNRLMGVMASVGLPDQGWTLLNIIDESGLRPTRETYALLLCCHGDYVTRKDVAKTVADMCARGLEVSGEDLLFMVQRVHLPAAYHLVRLLREQTGQPAPINIYAELVYMCSNIKGDPARLAAVLCDMKSAGHTPTPAVYISLLRALVAHGNMSSITKYLEVMKRKDIKLSVDAVNHILPACANAKVGITLYNWMNNIGLSANHSTFQAMLQLCKNENHFLQNRFTKLVGKPKPKKIPKNPTRLSEVIGQVG